MKLITTVRDKEEIVKIHLGKQKKNYPSLVLMKVFILLLFFFSVNYLYFTRNSRRVPITSWVLSETSRNTISWIYNLWKKGSTKSFQHSCHTNHHTVPRTCQITMQLRKKNPFQSSKRLLGDMKEGCARMILHPLPTKWHRSLVWIITTL